MVRFVNLRALFYKSLTNSTFTQVLNSAVNQLNKNSKKLTAIGLCTNFICK